VLRFCAGVNNNALLGGYAHLNTEVDCIVALEFGEGKAASGIQTVSRHQRNLSTEMLESHGFLADRRAVARSERNRTNVAVLIRVP
jgi:hypothetical protein